MKIVLQRVKSASVAVGEDVLGRMECGIVLLAGFGLGDEELKLDRVVERLLNLRIFPDDNGRLNFSLKEAGGGVLIVPQFTLFARVDRGRRPDFTEAMQPDRACLLFDAFVDEFRKTGISPVEMGKFGANMAVSLVNDGPFTLGLEFHTATNTNNQ